VVKAEILAETLAETLERRWRDAGESLEGTPRREIASCREG
jgi:hypothetical protein